jgi:arginyl-tRNA--protein-N-Asp/Glu arginylyltransferase
VYVYYDFALQGRRFRAVYKGVLALGLVVVYVYYDCDLQGVGLGAVCFKQEC